MPARYGCGTCNTQIRSPTARARFAVCDVTVIDVAAAAVEPLVMYASMFVPVVDDTTSTDPDGMERVTVTVAVASEVTAVVPAVMIVEIAPT
jgi:hypothetical protein